MARYCQEAAPWFLLCGFGGENQCRVAGYYGTGHCCILVPVGILPEARYDLNQTTITVLSVSVLKFATFFACMVHFELCNTGTGTGSSYKYRYMESPSTYRDSGCPGLGVSALFLRSGGSGSRGVGRVGAWPHWQERGPALVISAHLLHVGCMHGSR